MRKLRDIIGLTENKKEDEHRKVFKETDPELPFPNDTISALKREINTGAKDLETDWENAIELVDHAFRKLEVPKPTLSQRARWDQYQTLIADAVKQLYDARGLGGSWRTTRENP